MLLFAALLACSSGGVSPRDGSADLAGQPETTADRADVAEPDEVASAADVHSDTGIDFFVDTGEDSGFVPCDPGEGCFLDPCEENSDCQAGFCVDHMGEDVCTQLCQEECPPGWTCQQMGAGPDLLFACISKVANLCRPCSSGTDCKGLGGAEDACLDYGVEGSFCGGACAEDTDCPWGFSCGTTVTVDGIATVQCVADAGVCPCTSKSVQLGLWTPCEVTNEAGSCPGKRVCQEEGLGDCGAAQPVAEVCNGLDDECDGETDEPVFDDGSWKDLCDDANECTKDICGGIDGCSYEILDGVECKDGNPCTVADHCAAGVCGGTTVACDDENPCTDDSCNEMGGCVFENNLSKCDDGDPCTVADECVDGDCFGVAIPCDCQVDVECLPLEDGNLCNGTLFCDTSAYPYECQVIPESVVECPEPAGSDAICLKSSCDPESGACGLVPDHEGFACEDGNACTIGDLCQAGDCVPGDPLACADNNGCTDDACDSDEGCAFVANDSLCDDGDVCTTGDACAAGDCQGLGTLNCDDGNICNGAEACDSLVGCTPGTPLSCDDQDVCNGFETCDPGQGCQEGDLLDCGDGNPCTDDTCHPLEGCLQVANAAPCDDDNLCTISDQCANGKCKPGNPVECGDENVCTTDVCSPDSGCVHLLNSVPCDDEDLCTTGDYCHLGECTHKGELQCNDGNSCTNDSCKPETGCAHSANSADCEDGNACTLNDQCDQGWCLGKATPDCNDDNPCTDDSCDPDIGCVHVFNTVPCNDSDACTTGEACANGACLGGGEANCDDGNPCTDDSCVSPTGCVHLPNAESCEDGNECTASDMCGNAECQPGQSVTCDDSDKCTSDACNPQTGCLFTPIVPCCGNGIPENGEECDDGNDDEGDGCSSDCKSGVLVTMKLWGAGGSSGNSSQTLIGGPGGFTTATFKVSSGTKLRVVVGEGGKRYGLSKTFGGGGGGGSNGSYNGGSGGGGSFVFVEDTMPAVPANVISSAGGGGGCAGTYGNPNSGGPGGGTNGGNGYAGSNPAEVGKGGTQNAGGAPGTDTGGTAGAFYQGGTGNGATSNVGSGGGGGGFYGGGGGAGRSGAGGGGSGHINKNPPAGITFISGETTGISPSGGAALKSPPGTGDPDYGSQAGMSFNSGSFNGNPGRVVIAFEGQKFVFSYTGSVQVVTVN